MYLRVLFFDQSGARTYPFGQFEAMLPLAKVPGTRRTAREFLAVRPDSRAHGVVSILANQKAAKAPRPFSGMAAIACPGRHDADRSFHLSLAVCAPGGDIVHAKWSLRSLAEARAKSASVARQILSQPATASG